MITSEKSDFQEAGKKWAGADEAFGERLPTSDTLLRTLTQFGPHHSIIDRFRKKVGASAIKHKIADYTTLFTRLIPSFS